MRLHARAKILRRRDDARDGVVGELSWNLNQNDCVKLVRSMTILNVGGCSEVAVRN
jgi:hypothetical protein